MISAVNDDNHSQKHFKKKYNLCRFIIYNIYWYTYSWHIVLTIETNIV